MKYTHTDKLKGGLIMGSIKNIGKIAGTVVGVGNNNRLGLLRLVPCVAMGVLFGFKWFQNIVKSKD